jgi:septation ring formation regulator EzrA
MVYLASALVMLIVLTAVVVSYFFLKRTDAIRREQLEARKKYEADRCLTDEHGQKVWVPLPGDEKGRSAEKNPSGDAAGWGGIDLPPGHYP